MRVRRIDSRRLVGGGPQGSPDNRRITARTVMELTCADFQVRFVEGSPNNCSAQRPAEDDAFGLLVAGGIVTLEILR